MRDTITQFRKAIPEHCFQSNAWVSLAYMLLDLTLFSTCVWVYPFVSGVAAHLLYWNVYGFLGWCIFVIGHDCGHGSFSRYPVLNAVCGHICHGILMVPYFPWARSHHKHHCYHNHKDKDRSHPWNTPAELENSHPIMRRALPTILAPFISFWAYIFVGMSPDGCHIVWFGRLYDGASSFEKIKGCVSTAVIGAWIALVYFAAGSWVQFWLQYGGTIALTYVWLFMVTWFQHHDEHTLVYNDDNWSFLRGGMQTVDRTVGYGIDEMHHHITDCHIVHHMFFTSIPHYHLREATDAVYAYAQEHDCKGLKRVDHTQYPLKFIYDFFTVYPKIHMTGWFWGQ